MISIISLLNIFSKHITLLYFYKWEYKCTQMQKLKMVCCSYLNIFSCQQFFWWGGNRYKVQHTYVAFSTIFLVTLLMNMSQYFYNVYIYKKLSYKLLVRRSIVLTLEQQNLIHIILILCKSSIY